MDKQWKYYLQILSKKNATWKELFDGAIPFITFLVFFVSQKRRSPGEGQQLYLYKTRTLKPAINHTNNFIFIQKKTK